MSDVFGSYCRIQGSRSRRSRKSLLTAAATTALAITTAHANTQLSVPDGTPNLSTLSPVSSSDLTFTNITYGTTSYTDGAATLTLGSLDDLDATQALFIADTGPIVFSGGSNSVSGTATDIIDVAAGGTLDLSGVPLSLATSTTATIDVNGTLNIGTWSTVAGSTYTFTGGGTTNVSVTGNNTATFLGNINVSSGTLISNATSFVGTGTYASNTLGTGTIMLGSGGSANATIITNETEVLSNGSLSNSGTFSNPITTVAGTTGTLRVEGIPVQSGATASFSGRLSVTSGTALTLGPGGNSGNFQNIMGVRGNPTEVFNGGTLNIDAGVNTLSSGLPNIVDLAATGTFGLAGATTASYATVNVQSGCLRIAGSSSGFNSKFAQLNMSANTQLDLVTSLECAGIDGPSSAVVYNSNTYNYGTAPNSTRTLTSQGTLSTSAVYNYAGQITLPTSLYSSAYPVSIATASGFNGTQIYSGNLNILSLPSASAYATVTAAAGTLEFTGNDTFSNAVYTTGGTLNFAATSTFNGNVSSDGGTLLFSTAGQTFTGPVNVGSIEASNGSVALSGGTLILNGTNTFATPSSGVTITDGTFSTNNFANLGTVTTVPLGFTQPVFSNPSLVATAYSGTLQYTGPTASTSLVISGAPANSGTGYVGIGYNYAANPALGNFAMAGTGTLTMTGQSTYAGTTYLKAGTLSLGAAENPGTSGPIGNGGTISFSGGTLQYTSVDQYDYSPRFATTAGQAYNVDTNGQAITFASPLVSSTGNLTVSDSVGTGSLLLSGSNTFGGSVTVNSGELVLGNGSALGGPLFTNGGTVSYSLGKAATTVNAGALDLHGNSISGLQLTLTGTGNGGTGALINTGGAATIGLGSGIGTFLVSNLGSGLTSNGTATISATGVTGFAATGSIGATSLTTTSGSGYTGAGSVTVTGGGGTGMTVSTGLLNGGIVFTLTNPGTGYTSQPTFTLNGVTPTTGGTVAAVTSANLGLVSVTVTSFGTANSGFSLSNLPTLTVSGSGLTTNATIAVSPVELSLNGPLTIGGTGDITVNDPITQTTGQNYGITKAGSNTLTLAASSNYTGSTTINGGTLNVTGVLGGSGTVTLAGTGNVVLAGANALLSTAPITVGSTSNLYATNSQTLASIASTGSTVFSSGTSIIGQGNGTGTGAGGSSTAGGISGSGTLTVNGSGNLYASHITQAMLNIGSSSTVTIADSSAPSNNASVSVLTDLSNSGTLDLKNNDMIINDASQYATVKAQIINAQNGGNWNQPGVTSSSAAANHLTGLGYGQVGTGSGQLNVSSFDGQPVSSGATLVKYTLYGDLLLTGSVTATDFNIILPNYNKAVTGGWSQGDLFGTGQVTAADFNAMLPNYNKSDSTLSPSVLVSPSLNVAKTSAVSRSLSVSPALTLYSWDAQLPNAQNGQVVLKVDDVTTDSNYGDVILQGNNVTIDSLHITSASGKLQASTTDTKSHYNSFADQSAGTDQSTDSGGHWSLINATTTDVYEAGIDHEVLTFTSNAESYDMGKGTTVAKTSAPAWGVSSAHQLFVGLAGDLTATYGDLQGNTDPITVEYLSSTQSTPEPASLGVLAAGGVMMMRRRRTPAKAKAIA